VNLFIFQVIRLLIYDDHIGIVWNWLQAVSWIRELATEVDATSLPPFLADCIGAPLGNGLGLMVLLPPTSVESREIVDSAVRGANGAIDAWIKSCRDATGNLNAVTNRLLGLCEVLLMQRSADSEAPLELSERARTNLPVALGPADQLLRLAVSDEEEAEAENEADDYEGPFSVGDDMLPSLPNMCPSELWLTSVLGHVVAIVGGLDQADATCPLPPTLEPFARLVRPSRDKLDRTYWPGLPDNEWHSWLQSALYRYRLGQGNVGVAECECGYKYLLGECIAPTTSQPCGNPDSHCKLMNGGASHSFAPGQSLVAVPRETGSVHSKFRKGCDMSPRPGLWPLIDGELSTLLRRGNARDATESNAATSVRGLEPLTFRTLHLLVHAGALASALMERAARGPERCLEALQKHLKVGADSARCATETLG